ncbi:MAG: hypothetical protein JO199_08655 [Candidatus Eremiobacteraeota bacterium]|nr:hypothetical protein [Candidatus Eremiobacteraeota bacterium]
MKHVAALAAFLVASLVPAAADTDARAVYLGSWDGDSTFYATEMSKAGKGTGHIDCAWREGTTYLVCSQHFTGSLGSGSGLAVYTHPSPDKYGFLGVDPDGTTRTPSFTARNDGSLVYESSFEQKGQKVVMQTVNEFPSPGVENWYVQYSLDGGKTWVRMGDGVSRRSSGS